MSNAALESYLDQQIALLQDAGVFRTMAVVEGPTGPRSAINGRDVINLASNNYLGLATHPALKHAAIAAIEKYGAGSGAVRTIVGSLDIHEELERRLAAFKGTEACLVFQSGFTANAGVLGVLLTDADLVISDTLNHASIIDGIRLTKAARAVYQHNNTDDLERILRDNAGKFTKTVIVTDGVFSMDGDIAPLGRISELAAEYGAIAMVDDAHASGVLGDHGRGTVNHYGIPHYKWDISVGTLSKAVGVLGGYVACSKKLRILMEHRARPFLFSTSHPPAVTAAVIAALDIMESDEGVELMGTLWSNTVLFKEGLQALGFDTGISQTPITPIIVGDEAAAMKFSDDLFAAGVYCTAIAFPTVARSRARVRTIVTAAHTPDDLAEALEVFAKVGRANGIIG
jgi:glycine C-acetyltransferase